MSALMNWMGMKATPAGRFGQALNAELASVRSEYAVIGITIRDQVSEQIQDPSLAQFVENAGGHVRVGRYRAATNISLADRDRLIVRCRSNRNNSIILAFDTA